MAEPAAWLRGWRTGSRGTIADRWCSDLFQFSLNQLRSRALTFLNLETNVTVDLRVLTDCTPNVHRPGGGGCTADWPCGPRLQLRELDVSGQQLAVGWPPWVWRPKARAGPFLGGILTWCLSAIDMLCL